METETETELPSRTKVECQPLFSQLGLGVSRCTAYLSDATEPAVLAVRDALGKIALPPLDSVDCGRDDNASCKERRLLAQIKLGVPADGGTAPQRPMHVDRAAVMNQAGHYDIDVLPVQIVLGGLVVEDDAAGVHGGLAGTGSGLCIAVASLTIAVAIVEREELPQVPPPQGRTESSTVSAQKEIKASASSHRKRRGEASGRAETTAQKMSCDTNKRQKNATQPSGQRVCQTEKGQKESSDCWPKPSPKADSQEVDAKAKKDRLSNLSNKSAPVSSPSKLSSGDAPVSDNPAGSHNFSIHSHPSYTDHAGELPTPAELAQFEDLSLSYKTPPFPMRLHRLLEEVSRCPDRSAIVGWLSHGRAFRVLDVDAFVSTILPEYFRLTKYCSFLRQLNLYGFRRIGTGPDRGSYYSEWFLCGRPVLTSRMRRVRVNGNGRRIASDPDTEPDFYSMPPVEALEGAATATEVGDSLAGNAGCVEAKEDTLSDGDRVPGREMTSLVQNSDDKPVGSIVSSEDTVSEDDAGSGLLALRAGV